MPARSPADGVPAVSLRLEGEEVPAATFFAAAGSLLTLLREVGRSVAGEKPVEWRLADLRGGSAVVTLRPSVESADGASAAIHRALTGLAEMDAAARRPAHFTDRALRSARRLGSLTKAAGRLVVYAEGQSAETPACSVSGRLAEHAARLLPSAHTATGSVEGRLEALTIHGNNSFVVFDTLTGHGVECRCDRETLDRAAAHLGKRVLAKGEIRYGADGKPKWVAVEWFRLLGAGPLPRNEDMVGLFADDPIPIDEWSRYVRAK